MHKGKLKTDFKGNRSIPGPGTSRPDHISPKQRKQYAHNVPALRVGSKSPRIPIITDRRSVESGGN
jgi:hypothetical protein